MKKNISSVFFLILFGQIFAQNGFYIKPAINYLKLHRNNDVGQTFNSKSGSQIELCTKNFYPTFPDLRLGINLGYKTTNFFFEAGLYQDGTNNYIKLNYIAYNNIENIYYSSSFSSYAGIEQRSYPFRIGIKILQKKSTLYDKITYSLFLSGGIEIQSNYGNIKPQLSETSYTPDGINEIKITIQTTAGVRRAYHPSIGLQFEVKNNSDYNLFNLNINYNLSFIHAGWLQARSVKIEDVDKKQYYIGDFSSTGSGLYLGISKSIYFNRIFKKKK